MGTQTTRMLLFFKKIENYSGFNEELKINLKDECPEDDQQDFSIIYQ